MKYLSLASCAMMLSFGVTEAKTNDQVVMRLKLLEEKVDLVNNELEDLQYHKSILEDKVYILQNALLTNCVSRRANVDGDTNDDDGADTRGTNPEDAINQCLRLRDGRLIISCPTTIKNKVLMRSRVVVRSDLIIYKGNVLVHSGGENATGNVVIGTRQVKDNTGRDNLVIGATNKFKSVGGIVVGINNIISEVGASVLGGEGNIASGAQSIVLGGFHNNATGRGASIVGGENNEATGEYASVSAGSYNDAAGKDAGVLGGEYNNAEGDGASISGGAFNNAEGAVASISGGSRNNATGFAASVSGGDSNTANATDSSVSGGGYNIADAHYASISGGERNEATGEYASVSAGRDNDATGKATGVSGGYYNEARY